MPTITKDIITLPTLKVFAMTDSSNHPFVLSFHANDPVFGDIYFEVTPNRSNPVTKIPVYAGICHSTSSFMEMLVAYGCKYIKRLPISKGEILSRDYLDGLADGIIIPNPKTEGQLTKSKSKSEIINDFLELLNEDYDDDWTDFCITQRIITP